MHQAGVVYAGPRAFTLTANERKDALEAVLQNTTVLTMTLDEAAHVTGCMDPYAACKQLLTRPGAAVEWVVIKCGERGAIVGFHADAARLQIEIVAQSAFSVPVEDTVGCGDSFAAAVRTNHLNMCTAEQDRGHAHVHHVLLPAANFNAA